MTDDVIQLNKIGKIGTVKVYNQAYVDKQQKRGGKMNKMNKEELEKEAEKYADTVKCEWENDTYWVDCRDKVTDAYLASAEPREKRIEELEAQIEKMKSDVLSLIKDGMNDDIDQNIIERLVEKWEIKEK